MVSTPGMVTPARGVVYTASGNPLVTACRDPGVPASCKTIGSRIRRRVILNGPQPHRRPVIVHGDMLGPVAAGVAPGLRMREDPPAADKA